MKRIFEIGDLVTLTTDTYMDLGKGAVGIVTATHHNTKCTNKCVD
jgi:hypothetical protein